MVVDYQFMEILVVNKTKVVYNKFVFFEKYYQLVRGMKCHVVVIEK